VCRWRDSHTGFGTEHGKLTCDVKGKRSSASEAGNTDAQVSVGPDQCSEETPVMGAERKVWRIFVGYGSTGKPGRTRQPTRCDEPYDGRLSSTVLWGTGGEIPSVYPARENLALVEHGVRFPIVRLSLLALGDIGRSAYRSAFAGINVAAVRKALPPNAIRRSERDIVRACPVRAAATR
jgi:hypothetical protein